MKFAKPNLLRFLRITLIITMILGSFGILAPTNGKAFAEGEAATYRVATTGSDTSSCGSTTTPCRSIQYALNKSATGDTILVAAGTYTYNPNADTCSFLITRAVACFVDKHLTILGGYAPGSWSNPNPSAYPTVIDGSGSSRGVAIIAYNSTASLLMEGFTIQNGLAQGKGSGNDFEISAYGGGMWAQLGTVTLRNMIFRNNRSAGGNTSSQYGGGSGGGGLAVQAPGGVTSVLENVFFENNLAQGGTGVRRGGVALGGGLYTFQSAVIATGLTFMSNQAIAGDSSGVGTDTTHGLRADALGGGAAFSIDSSVSLTNIEAQGNKALGGDAGTGSGAIAGGGFGGFLHAEKSPLTLVNVTARDNQAVGGRAATGGVAFGGGLMTDSGDVSFDRVVAIQNAAISGASLNGGYAGAPSGGGAYLTNFDGVQRDATIVNTIFADNRIEVGSPGASVGGGGAGLVIQAIYATINHSTFARNYFVGDVKSGQALIVHGLNGESGTPSTANIRYTVIANHVQPYTANTSALTVARNSTANLTRVMFAGNTNNTNSNGLPLPVGTITGMSTTQTVDSISFVSPGNPNYNYHLQSNSPAIDQAQGSNLNLDVDGEARPVSSYPDIGADEFSLQSIAVGTSLVNALVSGSADYTRLIQVILPDPAAIWTAVTSANWLFLGGGNSHQQSGVSGDYLLISIEASLVESTTQSTTITISGGEAQPASLPVNMVRVNDVYYIHLPLTVH